MKIGILTFHWATNYGAILQAFALQEYLKSIGHDVEIVNYKPKQFDLTLPNLIRAPRKLMHPGNIIRERTKEESLQRWREKHLNTTKRYFRAADITDDAKKYDLLISGSDQILNAYFTTKGEDECPSSAYYLAFANDVKRIGYAVSFGCIKYPEYAKSTAESWINGFDAISVREQTGLSILDDLHYGGRKTLVPDPTILIGRKLFEYCGVAVPEKKQDYTCVYMLRREIVLEGNVHYIDESHHPLKMEEWLSTIINAGRLVTNSYHGMIMALLAHVPFVALLEKGIEGGMNDRFETLLSHLDLTNRMITNVQEVEAVLSQQIDFYSVDEAMAEYRKLGVDFLSSELKL